MRTDCRERPEAQVTPGPKVTGQERCAETKQKILGGNITKDPCSNSASSVTE